MPSGAQSDEFERGFIRDGLSLTELHLLLNLEAMERCAMALTDAVVQRARSRDKDYTLSDADGLALFIPMKGKKKWHFRFTLGNSEPRISLGLYPDISLKRARELRDEMRTLVAEGIDPRIYRREAKRSVLKAAENTFEAVYECWRDHKALSLRSGRQSTLSQIKRIFAKDVLPSIGERSIFDVGRADLLDILRKVEARKALTTAEKLRTWFNQMFRWARIKLSLADNPAADLDIVAVPQSVSQDGADAGLLGEAPNLWRCRDHDSGYLALVVDWGTHWGAEIRYTRSDPYRQGAVDHSP
jgi:Arm DNA-binding domain